MFDLIEPMPQVVRVSLVLLLVAAPGCGFIDPGVGGTIGFDGNMSADDGSYTMSGQVYFAGGNMPQGTYENISVYYYDRNKTLIHREPVGTIHNKTERISVNVHLNRTPHYIILYSSDLWDGETAVAYYVWSEYPEIQYENDAAAKPSELPVNPGSD